MQSQLLSISKIFTERLLRIPDYQRGYAWTEKQLKDFWNDLLQLEEEKNHYTGVLTLEDVPGEIVKTWSDDYWIIYSKGYAPHYIVDGQQRLTTSIILIQAIIECVPENQKLNYTTVDDIKKKFIYDSKDDGISRSYIFGYEKDNPSYEFLKTKIFLDRSDNSFPLQETFYTHNLEFAKKFFLERLKSISLEEIEIIYRKLTQSFLFNIYSIADEVDVFVAFETMNNRGKPLSHLELLKNRLIYLSTKFNTHDFEKNKLRHTINETWKSVYHYLGKNKLNPLDDDVFLHNHFTIHFSNGIDRANLGPSELGPRYSYYLHGDGSYSYKDYLLEEVFTARNIIDNELEKRNKSLTIKDIYSYVHSLKESVEIWYHLLNPKDSFFSPEEKVWLEKLNRMDFIVVAPLVMVFYQKEQDIEMRVRLLRVVERYLFLSLINVIYTSPSRRIRLVRFTNLIASNKTTTDKFVKEFEQFVDSIFSDSDNIAQIRSEFRNKNYYTWRGIKYFLFEYEMYLQEASKSYRKKIDSDVYFSEDNKDYYTIEHIYPQKPGRTPCWIEAFRKYNDKEKALLRHSLGNLVPLSRPKNSSLQNKCFEDKKGNGNNYVGFRYGSYSENEVANYDNWTAVEILGRGIKLLDFMEIRWKMNLGTLQDKIRLLNLDFVPLKEDMEFG